MAETYNIKVFRFDPSIDETSSFKIYEVPNEFPDMGPMSALKALRYIHEYIEPISFEFNCRVGTCGRCAIMFDGVPRLACWAPLSGEHTLEPLKGFPIVKDLVVDIDKVRIRFIESDTSIKTLAPIDKLPDIDGKLWWDELQYLNACRECMACYATCTALQMDNKWESFIGPGAMAQIYMRSIDTEDRADRVSQAAFSGAFECVQCGNCTAVCPAHIPITADIGKLQDQAAARGLKPADTTAPNWPLA